MARPPYREPDYRAAVEALRAFPVPCSCGAPATTVDHAPPLALHPHRPGSGCCHLVPACRRCNLGQGRAVALARRAAIARNSSRAW